MLKEEEIIPTTLRYPEDNIIIVDPEDEVQLVLVENWVQKLSQSLLGRNITFNLLDLPDKDKLQAEDSDPIGQKNQTLINLV